LIKECREKKEIALRDCEVNEKRKVWWTKDRKEKVSNTRKKTFIERYGVSGPMQIKSVCEELRKVNEKNGRWASLDKKTDYELYFMRVRSITRKKENISE
jgi:hypothetical protein